MDVLKVQLVASKVGIFIQMTNQLSIRKKKKNITSIAWGLMQMHSMFILGIPKHLNMM